MRLVRQGAVPAPMRLTDNKKGNLRFVQEDLENWVASKLAEARGLPAPVADPATEFVSESSRIAAVRRAGEA